MAMPMRSLLEDVLVDVARQENGRYSLFDGDHEAWPDPAYCKQVASSFSEFLEQLAGKKKGRQTEA
jgi:hypothetical protein